MNLFSSNSENSSVHNEEKKNINKAYNNDTILLSNNETNKIKKRKNGLKKNCLFSSNSDSNNDIDKKNKIKKRKKKLKKGNNILSNKLDGSYNHDVTEFEKKEKNLFNNNINDKIHSPEKGKNKTTEKSLFSSNSSDTKSEKNRNGMTFNYSLFSDDNSESVVSQGVNKKKIKIGYNESLKSEKNKIASRNNKKNKRLNSRAKLNNISNISKSSNSSNENRNKKKKKYEHNLFEDDTLESYVSHEEEEERSDNKKNKKTKKLTKIVKKNKGKNKIANNNETLDKYIENDVREIKKNDNEDKNKSSGFANETYDSKKSRSESLYRLVKFEQLKKKAQRKLKFLSIVDMEKDENESESESENESENDYSEADSILNESDKSSKTLENSFFSDNYEHSENDETQNNSEQSENIDTIDIYNYYYIDNEVKDVNKKIDLEKVIPPSTEARYDELYNMLFGFDNSKSVKNVDINPSNNNEDKNGSIHAYNENRCKESQKNKEKKKEIKKSLEKNFILYRNFRNLNNEISRQNNKKGLILKEIVSSFIRLINENMLNNVGNVGNGENGEHVGNRELGEKRTSRIEYEEDFNETSEVEEMFISFEQNENNKRGDEELFNIDNVGNVCSGELKNENIDSLKNKECFCLFCKEQNEVLQKDKINLIIFKIIKDNKNKNTMIKSFFMNNYIFKLFINHSIHNKYIIVVCKERKNEKGYKYSSYYKWSTLIIKRFNIKKILHVIPKKVVLTNIAIHIYAINILNENEKLIVVINFLKWKKIRKNYHEILKLNNKERYTNLIIYKKFSFFINLIDKYCSIKNINLDINNNDDKMGCNARISNIDKSEFYGNPNKIKNNTHYSNTYNELKVNEIEENLNIHLENSDLQFVLVDPLNVSSHNESYLYPSHCVILF
ncbi:conserved Plasmodium protein, unknown function [Plasmodium vinckei vinckei]|uniref:Uncharacterized protein n=1 Tax=Plasmodium vinckei vinckei TaxID=54757 RepID=A0A081ICM4_PLAVN|nr:conserved Plasmodium protein, unknown function [Plasmodium vinckei vinckei]KEG01432.1 hypothetical protein YYE_03528 [Plasmodium vinckei vinckei]VEV55410.1 conserved Plasmodium protein, unknown function [Plasmodium vinckei vinckei]